MVNMKYISKLVRYYVILENGERISIPKGGIERLLTAI